MNPGCYGLGEAVHNRVRTEPTTAFVNIIILDDYQDAVRKLKCATVMERLNAKVFTNTVKGIGQLPDEPAAT